MVLAPLYSGYGGMSIFINLSPQFCSFYYFEIVLRSSEMHKKIL